MINLFKTKLWRGFSLLPPPESGIYDVLARSPSLVFSLSLLPLFPPKIPPCRSLASPPVADMPDSPETALHFIFMYDPDDVSYR